MEHWSLPTAAGALDRGLPRLIAHLGRPDFAGAALLGLHEAGLPAASWSVYQLRPGLPPQLHLSASQGVADTTRQCFSAYLDTGLYQRDLSFDAVRPGHAAVLHMPAEQAPSAAHREAIYLRHGMLERLSVVQRGAGGELLAINLYRHQHQGLFGPGELAGFAGQAPLLLATVLRHLELAPAELPPAAPRERLLALCPALTVREIDVCERLLRGWSYDGIAADLGLSTATVKTYRARAFERLGLHFKSELFAALQPPL